MQVETIRALFTYLAALVVIIGGGLILFFTYATPGGENLLVMVGGFIGFALQFLFGAEVQARTAHQSNTSAATGAAAAHVVNGGT